MGFSLFQQQITVACLAFSSGLLLGLAFYRGEVGDLGRSRRAVRTSPHNAPAPPRKRRKRKRFKLSDLRRSLVGAVEDLDPALAWVLAALGVLLIASAAITTLAD